MIMVVIEEGGKGVVGGEIGEGNDIELIRCECEYEGDCLGSCGKCEGEVGYLEEEVEGKGGVGKGMSVFGVV